MHQPTFSILDPDEDSVDETFVSEQNSAYAPNSPSFEKTILALSLSLWGVTLIFWILLATIGAIVMPLVAHIALFSLWTAMIGACLFAFYWS